MYNTICGQKLICQHFVNYILNNYLLYISSTTCHAAPWLPEWSWVDPVISIVFSPADHPMMIWIIEDQSLKPGFTADCFNEGILAGIAGAARFTLQRARVGVNLVQMNTLVGLSKAEAPMIDQNLEQYELCIWHHASPGVIDHNYFWSHCYSSCALLAPLIKLLLAGVARTIGLA